MAITKNPYRYPSSYHNLFLNPSPSFFPITMTFASPEAAAYERWRILAFRRSLREATTSTFPCPPAFASWEDAYKSTLPVRTALSGNKLTLTLTSASAQSSPLDAFAAPKDTTEALPTDDFASPPSISPEAAASHALFLMRNAILHSGRFDLMASFEAFTTTEDMPEAIQFFQAHVPEHETIQIAEALADYDHACKGEQ